MHPIRIGFSITFVVCTASNLAAGPLSLLHSFDEGANDAGNPNAGLVTDGTALYGTTYGNFAGDSGAIYRINLDGTGFQVLRAFGGEPVDGANPGGNLLLSGNTLYGTTFNGGQFDSGTVFSMNTDGSNFRLLHEFTGDRGNSPVAGLITDGAALFGTTSSGGRHARGTVYRIEVDGSGFQLLHEFTGNSDGGSPTGLVVVGSTLFGTTFTGGSEGRGAVFRVDTDGSGFQVIHSFAGFEVDGQSPPGGFVTDGFALYGTTESGGINQAGIIFRLNFDGSGHQVLHRLYESTEGCDPRNLTIIGSQLYGTTDSGGVHNNGTLFTIDTDGGGFRRLHSFGPGPDNGSPPMRIIVNADSRIYGTVKFGGANEGGALYKLEIPQSIGTSRFDEPSVGSGSYVPGPTGQELGFVTTQSTTGGVSPWAAVFANGESRTLVHRSLHAITRFNVVDITDWYGVEVSLDMQVSNTTFEDGDFVHIYITDGVASVDLFNRQATSANNDPFDLLANRGFVNISSAVPTEWTSVQLVIESASNSSQGAEQFDFDNAIISGAPIPIPEPSSLTLAALAFSICPLAVRRPRCR